MPLYHSNTRVLSKVDPDSAMARADAKRAAEPEPSSFAPGARFSALFAASRSSR
jgi:hypothetical protein